MEENFCPIDSKKDRLAIVYLITLMFNELGKEVSVNLDSLIRDLNLTKVECDEFISKKDVKSLIHSLSKFDNFTKDYLVTAINEVLFANSPLSIENNEFVNDFLVDNAGFTNGEFNRRNKKINLIVNQFVSKSDSNEVKSDSNEINESNPIAKFLKIITLILFTSFIGVMFKECYKGKKLFEDSTTYRDDDFVTDSATSIVDSAVLHVANDMQNEYPQSVENNSVYEDENEIRKEYYPNGQLKIESNFKNNLQDGLTYQYYENGQIETKLFYKKGLVDGLVTQYYQTGSLKNETTFKLGERHGTRKDYYINGNLKIESFFISGKENGVRKEYHENGKLKSIGNFKDRKLNGVVKEYNDSGILLYENHYVDGKSIKFINYLVDVYKE